MDKSLRNPLYKGIYTIRHSTLSTLPAMSPLISLALVYAISLYKDFDSVNRTHCKVPNIIPSISSCIGNNTPQRYIWRTGIALMLTPRLVSGLVYYQFFKVEHQAHNWFFKSINNLKLILFMLEYFSLTCLTFIGTTENHDIHELSTITFMVFSTLHMWCMLYLYPTSRVGPMTKRESKSFKYKVTTVLAHNIFAFAMIATYIKHNTVCIPYMYSYFAFCELMCVLLNIAFHCTEIIDFEGMSFVLGSPAVKEN